MQNSKGGITKMFDKICLILTILGGINWGLIGLVQFDLVAWLGGGQSAVLSRVIYTVVCLAALWCITLLFRSRQSIGVGMKEQESY